MQNCDKEVWRFHPTSQFCQFALKYKIPISSTTEKQKGKTKTVTKAVDHTKELTPKNFCYQKCRHAWNDGRGKTKTWGKRG
jgi:hypothetical protein